MYTYSKAIICICLGILVLLVAILVPDRSVVFSNVIISKNETSNIIPKDGPENHFEEKNHAITSSTSPEEKLEYLHKKLKLSYGSFTEEYPEQVMAATYLKGPEIVLEIGGNIGRNSLVIASLLNDSRHLLTLECDPVSYSKLIQNRDQNQLHFQAECSALSKRPLVQDGWVTSVVFNQTSKVPTITYEQLVQKYPLKFDTLILDCEGAFYYILQDMPEVLDGIRLIMMENDYRSMDEYNFVAQTLTDRGFVNVYRKPHEGALCADNFYEVWIV